MTCSEVRERFLDLEDGALAEDERRALDAHLATCASCREDLARYRATVAWLHTVEPVRAPVGFVDRVLGTVAPMPWYRRLARQLLFPLRVKLPVEATALVLVAIGVVYVFQRTPELQQAARVESLAPGPPSPPAETAPPPPAGPGTPGRAPSTDAPGRSPAAPDVASQTPAERGAGSSVSGPHGSAAERKSARAVESRDAVTPGRSDRRAADERATDAEAGRTPRDAPQSEALRRPGPPAPARSGEERAQSPSRSGADPSVESAAEAPRERSTAPLDAPPRSPGARAPAPMQDRAETSGRSTGEPRVERRAEAPARSTEAPSSEGRAEPGARPRATPFNAPPESPAPRTTAPSTAGKADARSPSTAAQPQVASKASIPDAVGRVSARDPASAESQIAVLAVRHGGRVVSRRAGPDGVVVEVRVPRDRYRALVEALGDLGRFTPEREAAALPPEVWLAIHFD
jgi:hypothetical protein